MSAKQHAFDESWFEHSAAQRVSTPSPPSVSEPTRPEGRRGWAMTLGALGGAGGGAAMLVVAQQIAARLGSTVDIVGTIGRPAMRFTDARTGGFAIAIATGAVVGIAIGALFRHSLRIFPRILAGALLASVLWTLVQAFVLTKLALPFGPMVAGAAVYGICVALIPPPKKRYT
jgi:hypothetical protein